MIASERRRGKKRERINAPATKQKNVNSLTKTKMIITYLGKNCKKYREEIGKIYEKQWFCPDCHSRAYLHGVYTRKARESSVDGSEEEIEIIRIKCTGAECGKTHAILPDFLCPNKRYGSVEISGAIEEYEENGNTCYAETCSEESTIRRWLKGYKEKLCGIVRELEKVLLSEYGKQVSLIDTAVNGLARLRLIAGKMMEIKHSSIIGEINQILSLNGLKIFL